jgi:hypothetical protein
LFFDYNFSSKHVRLTFRIERCSPVRWRCLRIYVFSTIRSRSLFFTVHDFSPCVSKGPQRMDFQRSPIHCVPLSKGFSLHSFVELQKSNTWSRSLFEWSRNIRGNRRLTKNQTDDEWHETSIGPIRGITSSLLLKSTKTHNNTRE